MKSSHRYSLLTQPSGLVTCCIRWGVYLTHSAENIIPKVTGPMLSWAIIEGSVYLIAACLPMMRPIFMALTPHWLAQKLRTHTGTSVYHPKASGNRVSGQLLGRRNHPKSFSRLQDGNDVELSPTAEKGVAADAGVTKVPTADDIPLHEFRVSGSDSVFKKVEFSVTRDPA